MLAKAVRAARGDMEKSKLFSHHGAPFVRWDPTGGIQPTKSQPIFNVSIPGGNANVPGGLLSVILLLFHEPLCNGTTPND
jgi:hypothetical protein